MTHALNRPFIGLAFAALLMPAGLLIPATLATADTPKTKAATQANSAHLLPPSTTFYAELKKPAELIATIFDHPLRAKIEALPIYQEAIQSPEYQQAMMGVEMVENLFGMPWREAIETFAGGGVAVAADISAESAAVIVHGKDAESMTMFRDRVLGFAALDKDRKLQHVEYRGISAHRLDETRFAVYENKLLITNNSDFGKAILDRMLDGGDDHLGSQPRFIDATKSRGNVATAWAFFDVESFRSSGVADEFYYSQINNPVAELLVGGIQSNLQHTPFATASLSVATKGLSLKLSTPHQADWIPEEREYFFGPKGNGQAPRLPEVDQTLFTLSTFRDFSQMWLRAGDLFDDNINEEMAKADAGLTTFFSGKDFGEDILGSFESPAGFVMTRQDFHDVMPQPAIKIPAFGLVMQMKEPETTTKEMRRTFQNLIGFFSVVGAQQGFGQLEMDMEKMDNGVQFVSSNFIPDEDDKDSKEAAIVFNFSPTVGFNGDRFVVASTTKLAKELTLAKPSNPNRLADNTAADLQSNVLRQVLNDNREQLIAQNMLEEGNTREEAVTQIDLLLHAIEYFKDASFRLGQADSHLQAEIEIRVAE